MTSTENFYKTFDHVRKCIQNKLCIKKINPGQVTLRSDIQDFEEASVFVGAYEAVTCTNFKVCPSKEAVNRSVRRRQWICTNRLLNNGPLEVPAKCPAKITVSFKKVTKYSKAKDPFLRRNPPFQAVIKIVPDHNHLLTASDSVKQLKITSPLKECFYEYFKRGISGASAKSFHEQNLQRVNFHALSDDSMNPSLPAIDILYQDWKRMMKIVSSNKAHTSTVFEAVPTRNAQVNNLAQIAIDNRFVTDNNVPKCKIEPDENINADFGEISNEGFQNFGHGEDVKPILNIKKEIEDDYEDANEDVGLPVIESYGSLAVPSATKPVTVVGMNSANTRLVAYSKSSDTFKVVKYISVISKYMSSINHPANQYNSYLPFTLPPARIASHRM